MKCLCIAAIAAALVGANPDGPREGVPLNILDPSEHHAGALAVVDGQVAFVTIANGRITAKPGCAPLPDWSDEFVRHGQTLCVKMHPRTLDNARRVKGDYSKELLAEDGCYVTADYSTSPPRIVLTEKPTKNSLWSWSLVPRTGTVAYTSENYYIKNENDLGKETWLARGHKHDLPARPCTQVGPFVQKESPAGGR